MAFRTDIQALRGLAVSLVVLDHANLGLFGAGYLGVDIFFVVSGYLITGLVKKGIEQGNFSFSEFYFRRAKRLLPAAYVTFITTTLLAAMFLDASQLRDFAKQIVGAVTFTGNIVLWRQSGYFEGAATLKPLLHVWSLSLEEQYYLFLPASLVYIPRRFWFKSATLILIASLALCFALVTTKPSATFYLLPTRAWELAIGSLAALAAPSGIMKTRLVVSRLFWPSVFALVIIPIVPIGTSHPGVDALIVCFATVVVILRRHEALNTKGPRALAKVGDFSYSLYLVHWPIFAFINNAYIDEPPTGVRVVAVALALCLGFLLYRYVELPIRSTKIRKSRKVVGATLGASLALALAPFGVALARTPAVDYTEVRRVNFGFGIACEYSENFTPKAECRNSNKPALLVWGDSFAMHLVPGIIATTGAGVVQATQSECGPFIGLAPFDIAKGARFNTRSWAEDCLAFSQSVFDYLAATPSINVVVMSSPFNQYLAASDGDQVWRSLEIVEGRLVEGEPTVSRAVEAMRRTVKKLREIGKRVVVVAPPPTSGFDMASCLERKASGLFVFGTYRDCTIPVAVYHEKQALVLDFLKRIKYELGVPEVSFDEFLCSGSSCATSLDGKFVYRDKGHFSYDGSQLVARKMGMGDLLQTIAR
jgi:peptidoglycan/LPS O-acetylase OafA/YrhL